jgi:N-acetylglucosaminyldiphosphoundecaprenol N-acetyl-beta-D-mannosaminyltransferase
MQILRTNMKVDVLGVQFDNVSMEEAVHVALRLLQEGQKGFVVTPNPEIVWMCRKNASLREAVSQAALVLPDGIGILYGAKILGRPLKEKIPGIDFASQLLQEVSKRGTRVFLLGSKPGVAEEAAENLKRGQPDLIICGTADGYFKEDAPVLEKINASTAELVIVCLGAPKQEKWMMQNLGNTCANLILGLGGALDVYAGKIQRAPEKWQKAGLEWLYRLLKEPRRIGRMATLPLFIFSVIWQRIRGRA